MTTLVAQISPQLARQVAHAADTLGLSHSELTVEAVRQFVRAIAPAKRGGGGRKGPRKKANTT